MDRQNYDSQDRASISASRGKNGNYNILEMLKYTLNGKWFKTKTCRQIWVNTIAR